MSKRPWEHLPLPDLPIEYDPSVKNPNFFYENILKFFIPDMIRLMNNGLVMDQEKIKALKVTVDSVLQSVKERLKDNSVIQKFAEYQYPMKYKKYEEEIKLKLRTIDYYLKPYRKSDIIHRTYIMNLLVLDEDKRSKWTIKDVKKYNEFLPKPEFQAILNGRIEDEYPDLVKQAMEQLAKDKLDIWNKPRLAKLESPPEEKWSLFNPGSSKQKRELFKWLGVEPLAFSKYTGKPSWGREQLEDLQKMNNDPELDEVLQAFIDYSYSGIIKDNFLEAFDKFTINGILYGNYRLYGAKSMRNTSNSPNLLNMPSTGSIYSKPVKECLTAHEDYIIYSIDLSALEDRVIANLSKDRNKISLFTEGLDGHSLNACYYFKEEIAKLIGEYTDYKEASRKFKQLVDEGNKTAKAIRQRSKGPTFGLSYGAFPPKIASTVKCTIEEAEVIFNRYHNELYKDITAYREQILQYAKQHGYVHLGLGCRLYTDDPKRDIRTLANATVQFWSILTLLAINELYYLIDKNNYTEDIKVISTIYDSIYLEVRKDAAIIKWLNDTLVKLLTVTYLPNEIVHNEAEGELGHNWAQLHSIPNNATIEEIEQVLEEIDANKN